MRKHGIIIGVIFLFVICGSQAADSRAWDNEQDINPKSGQQMTSKDAETLEERLKTNADNLPAREKLIRYYFQAMVTSRSPELEEKRQRHVFWLIEHHPESELAGLPEAEMLPTGLSGSIDAYQHGKRLWLEQVQKHQDNPQILRNAAQFLIFFDSKTAQDLLKKALDLNPTDSETASRLAESYEQERMLANSADQKTTLAQKALSIREHALQTADSEQRFYALGSLATDAIEAGETQKAQEYASELLQDSEKFRKNWDYGNAVHMGNIVLGRVALQRGDIALAGQYLLAAGQTPGSPQLDSFGPDMTLAKELLEKGQRDVVITYLESCAKFWKMGGDKLQMWIATIKGGGTPDFFLNLRSNF